MKITPAPLEPDAVPFRLPGIMVRATQWGWVVQKAPGSRATAWSEKVKQYRTRFGLAARMAANPISLDLQTATFLSQGTEQVPRDILTQAALGKYFILVNADGTEWGHVPGPIYQEQPPSVLLPPVDGYDIWLDPSQLDAVDGDMITDLPNLGSLGGSLTPIGTLGPIFREGVSPTGLPALQFAASSGLRNAYGIQARPLTRFVVHNLPDFNQYTITYSSGLPIMASSWSAGFGSRSLVYYAGQISPALAVSPEGWMVTGALFNSNASLTFKDGTINGPLNLGVDGRNGFVLGATHTNATPFRGYVGEVLDYPFGLTVEQIALTQAYLVEKWTTP